ncbi:MAG: hypothetical protein ABIP65_09215 [Vicinamibacterales bacterium]
MASATLSPDQRAALTALASELRRVFGNRLRSVCGYNLYDTTGDTHSIVLVDHLSFDDLAACVPLARGWDARGLAVPLILEEDEFRRTLDVFPLEYGEIIAQHVVVDGADPFLGLAVSDEDRRRGCEQQAKSHLIHLRESYLETHGDPRAVSRLIGASSAGFQRLLQNMVALIQPAEHASAHDDLAQDAERYIGVPADLTREILASGPSGGPTTIADPTALLARYMSAIERVWEFVDAWKH